MEVGTAVAFLTQRLWTFAIEACIVEIAKSVARFLFTIGSIPNATELPIVLKRMCILQVFTDVFKNCSPQSSMKLACIVAIEEILVPCSDIPMDNKCAFIRLLLTLDSKPSRLLDQRIVNLSHALPQYMINVLSNVGEIEEASEDEEDDGEGEDDPNEDGD